MSLESGLRIATAQLDYIPLLRAKLGHWLPAEALTVDDPLKKIDDDFSVRTLQAQPEVQEAVNRLLHQNEVAYIDEVRSKLRQILQFARQRTIDVLVFPEGSIPPPLLDLLYEYSDDLAIFTGLGYIRDDDLPYLPQQEAESLRGHNAGVLVDGDSRVFVTKNTPADAETADVGDGTVFYELTRHDLRHRLALSICLDYLNQRDSYNKEGVDYALISALTPTTTDFLESAPRNYVRVFANHARYGGSTIVAPSLEAPAFTDRNGVKPLPSGEEGLIVVDFQGFGKKPSATTPPSNRLISRGSIFYASDAGETYEPSRIAGELSQMTNRDLIEGSPAAETTRRWRDAIATRPATQVFTQALDALLVQINQGTLSEADFAVYSANLVLHGTKTVRETRYQELQAFHELLVRHGNADTTFERVGAYDDKYRKAWETLAPVVRRVNRTEAHQYVRSTDDTSDDPEGVNERTFFATRLGNYDTSNAVQSLARQLSVLRTLSRLQDPALRLSYRLSTMESENGDLYPVFDVFGMTQARDDTDNVATLREGLGQQLGQTYSGAWNLSGTRAPPEMQLQQIYDLSAQGAHIPSVREDWASLTDFLRTLRQTVSVELYCRWKGKGSTSPSMALEAERTALTDSFVSDGFIDKAERSAAAFFARTASEESREGILTLGVRIGSDQPLSKSILLGIGVTLLGEARFEIVDHDDVTEDVEIGSFSPSVALRLFHPPYGPMQGRGLSSERTTSILVSGHSFPSDGVVLGTARTALGREDEIVDVHLDEQLRLRHTYIIGRTGSGKTNLLKVMARQDIAAGHGVGVIDPHGDLVDYLLGHVGGREHETLLLDFGHPDFVPILNPLDLDVESPADRSLAIEEFIRILVEQSYHEFYGPRFEDIVRLTLESISQPSYPWTPSVLDISRLLRSQDRRTWLRNLLGGSELSERWRVFDQQPDTEIAQVLHWALSKFSEMSQDGVLGQVLSGGKSTVSIDRAVRDGYVILVRIPEWEMSASAADFLGTFVQERIRRASYARLRGVGSVSKKPSTFYLYVDEFQNFATSGFENLVAEARKFSLSLTLANQNLGQLRRFSRFTGTTASGVVESLLANVATLAVLGVSSADETVLSDEMGIQRDAIRHIGAHSALVRMHPTSGGTMHTFTAQLKNAEDDSGSPRGMEQMATRMKQSGVWRDRSTISEAIASREREITDLVAKDRPRPIPNRRSLSRDPSLLDRSDDDGDDGDGGSTPTPTPTAS